MGRGYSRPIRHQIIADPIEVTRLVAADEACGELLQTGDVVLFHGHSWHAWLVQLWQRSRYSHCAIAIRGFDLGFDNNEVYILESVRVYDGLDCAIHGFPKSGVRVVALREKLAVYQLETPTHVADICVAKLQLSAAYGVAARQHYAQKLVKFAQQVCGLGYDSAPRHRVQEMFPSLRLTALESHYCNLKRHYDCSELVAVALVCMGILVPTFCCDRVTPGSFANGSEFQDSSFMTPAAVLCQTRYHLRIRPDPCQTVAYSDSEFELDSPLLPSPPAPNQTVFL